ncbi:helix-turn-helix domain-containing protein [Actinomadura macrotermitis]|nr:helix-turn-helix transcriptional regulator [Actinomadura macrotermitis]
MGIELRRIREARGLTLVQAAKLLDRSPASISKIENGYTKFYRRDLDMTLDRYRVGAPAFRERLHALNDAGRTKGWWQQYKNIDPATLDYIGLEAEARTVRIFEPDIIPGLFQTEEYARCVIEEVPLGDEEQDKEPYIELRMNRQRIMTGGSPPDMHVVIGEGVLRMLVGGREVMLDQLELLAELAQLPYVRLQVMPYCNGAHATVDGAVTLIEIDPDLTVCVTTHLLGTAYFDDDKAVRVCTLLFDRLCSSALEESESLTMIEQAIADLSIARG